MIYAFLLFLWGLLLALIAFAARNKLDRDRKAQQEKEEAEKKARIIKAYETIEVNKSNHRDHILSRLHDPNQDL